MGDSIIYKLKSGKPNKFLNFLSGFAGLAIPDAFFRQRLQGLLAQAPKHPDYDYIRKRVDYYIKTNQPFHVSDTNRLTRERSWIYYTGRIGDYTRKMFHTAYSFRPTRRNPMVSQMFPLEFLSGRCIFHPDTPTVVKSRLLTGDNSNSVILKLDKLRHFMFVHDTIPFRQKKDMAIFRGKIRQSRVRTKFLEMFFHHPMFDCGVVGRNEGCPDEWMREKKPSVNIWIINSLWPWKETTWLQT